MQPETQNLERVSVTDDLSFAAYFLSRYGVSDIQGKVYPPDILGVATWNGAYDLFYNALGQGRDPIRFRHSLKNARDRFDAHIPGSGRTGWRDVDTHRSPGRLPALFQQVLDYTSELTESEIYNRVFNLIRSSEPEPINTDDNEPEDTEVFFLEPKSNGNRSPDGNSHGGARRSKRSNMIGNMAEEWVKEYLKKSLGTGAESLRHHSQHGETPGYDISYIDRNGVKQAVEVKGTEGSVMTSFELTDNERAAAEQLGVKYTIWLVLNVGGDMTHKEISDPLGVSKTKGLIIKPNSWLVRGFSTNRPKG